MLGEKYLAVQMFVEKNYFLSPTQHQAQIKITTKMADFEHPFCND
jgi:hypothetical protein